MSDALAPSSDSLAVLSGLAEVAEGYEAAIVDLWGVLHDGVTAFPAALECVARFKASGRKLAILSNAPRRASAVAARNAELGIGPRHHDHVHSSGEDCWQHLKTRPDAWYRALGRRCLHIGPARDRGLRDGLDLDFVESVEAADFLLNTGAGKPEDRAEDFDPILDPALARGLPMICANPDRVVIRGGRPEICAGAIAERYEEKGGELRYHGKPDPGVFEACLVALGQPERRKVLVIGDSLTTDIAGGRAAGLDCLLITGGIHAAALGVDSGIDSDEVPEPARLARLCADKGVRPDAVLPVLRW